MGGGDLNVKKSWHPSTLKNQEKTWKAEQMKAEEDKKILEKKKELEAERFQEELENSGNSSKKDGKLGWMYKGPGSHVTREEYLLGRKIDKSFELLQKEEAGTSETPEKTQKSCYTIEHDINPECITRKDKNNAQVDMKRKILEDPLFMIRQHQEDTKRAITSNPIKMKQLSLLVESLKKKKSSKKSKSSHSHKKKKKKEKRKKHQKKKYSSSDSSCNTDSDERSKPSKSLKNKRKDKKNSKGENRSLFRNKKQSDDDRLHRNYCDESYKNIDERPYHNRRYESQREKRSCSRDRHNDNKKRRGNYKKPKISDEEMEQRRREMMKAAARRDEERKDNVMRYKEQIQREEEEEKNSEEFLRHYGSKSMSISVEHRIRSKAGTVQKGLGHMENNFLKK